MLKRTCLAVTLISLLTAGSVQAQEFYSPNRTGSSNFTTVSFGTANQGEDSSDKSVVEAVEDVVDLEVADDDDAAASQAATIEELREQVKLMSLRLRELEDDVAKKVKVAKKSEDVASASDYEDADERLKKLEKGFEKQGKSIDKIDSTIPGLVHSGHKKPKATFFGRIHLDYWAFPEADAGAAAIEGEDPLDRVEFRRMRIGIKGDLNDNVFYKYEGEFAGGVASSYRDAFIGLKNLPRFNTVIIGNHKRPYGLDHLNSSRYNVFTERPFIVEAFNEDARRLGISSNGVSEDQAWNWRYGLWNQELTQTRAGWQGDHYQSEIAGRLANTAWYDESSGGRGYFHWAVSGSWGEADGGSPDNVLRYRTRPEARTTSRFLNTDFINGAEQNSLLGVETVFNVGAFQMTAEYLQTFVNRDPTVGRDLNFGGGYIQAAYFLTGEHTPWVRKTGTLGRVKPYENFFSVRDGDGIRGKGLGAWQIAARYSYADLSDEDVLGGIGESFTLGLNWWWNPNARVQMNYIAGQARSRRLDAQDPATLLVDDADYQIFGIRWMVDF